MSQDTKTRRQVSEDDVRASGFRALEGIGRVANLSADDKRVRVTIECMGLTVKVNTTAMGARTAAKVGLLAVGDRVLFRARPLGIEGTTIHVGIVEVGAMSATGEEFCIWNIEKWAENIAHSGMAQIQFPSSLALAKPFRLSSRGENGRIYWSIVPDAEGVQAVVN